MKPTPPILPWKVGTDVHCETTTPGDKPFIATIVSVEEQEVTLVCKQDRRYFITLTPRSDIEVHRRPKRRIVFV